MKLIKKICFITVLFITLSFMVLPIQSNAINNSLTASNEQKLGMSFQHALETSNWAGYQSNYIIFGVQVGTVSFVSASWNVPAIQDGCQNGETNAASVWVGIDGASSSSSTIEQLGTDSFCQNGVPYYNAWYEFYGCSGSNCPSTTASITEFSVQPGDPIYASVSYNSISSKFTFYLIDEKPLHLGSETYYQYFSIQWGKNNAKLSSAEWIVERPCVNILNICFTEPLADFGTVTFVNGQATINGASYYIENTAYTKIDMIVWDTYLIDKDNLALPSSPPQFGTFTVTWYGYD